MTRLTPISGKKLSKIVEQLGFKLVHQKGSHKRYVHDDGRKTTIPTHGNEEIGIGLLIEILGQIKIPREEFLKLLKKR